jgi:proteasome-associated ATPase
LADTGLKKGDHIGFDLAVRLAYVRLSPPARESLFADDLPEDEFSQLGGLEQPIAQIQRALDFTIRFPEVAARYGVRDKRGILLCGPPGNGKTRLGRCTATYVGRLVPGVPCRFLSLVGGSDVYSMWLGESERKLCEIFEAAEAAAAEGPVVLFFDEIDALGRNRGSDCGGTAPDRILSTFLGLLDGVKRLSGVIVMAATNRPDTLDPALLRAGRFDLKIHIPRPNRSAARAVLQAYLKDLPLAASCGERQQIVEGFLSRIYSPNGEYSAVLTVKLNDGRNLPVSIKELVSGAMLENVVRMAAEEAAFRETRTGDPDGISEEDLVAALQQEICGIAGLITPANAKAYLGMIPQDAHPVAVSSVFQSSATRYIR